MMILNSPGRFTSNLKNFDKLYSTQFSDEKVVKDSLKAISQRSSNNVLIYDFDALPVDDIIRRPNSIFRSVFKDKIEAEKLKNTPYIVIKVDANKTEIIEVAMQCGFSHTFTSKDFMLLNLPLNIDSTRE